jgi:riboflavin transporter FmnP
MPNAEYTIYSNLNCIRSPESHQMLIRRIVFEVDSVCQGEQIYQLAVSKMRQIHSIINYFYLLAFFDQICQYNIKTFIGRIRQIPVQYGQFS